MGIIISISLLCQMASLQGQTAKFLKSFSIIQTKTVILQNKGLPKNNRANLPNKRLSKNNRVVQTAVSNNIFP